MNNKDLSGTQKGVDVSMPEYIFTFEDDHQDGDLWNSTSMFPYSEDPNFGKDFMENVYGSIKLPWEQEMPQGIFDQDYNRSNVANESIQSNQELEKFQTTPSSMTSPQSSLQKTPVESLATPEDVPKSPQRQSSAIDPFPMPIKAIEASIKSRKHKRNPNSSQKNRKDVVHKAIFRAMKRYYGQLFKAHQPSEVTKHNFRDKVRSFLKEIIDGSQNIYLDVIPQVAKPLDSCSHYGMENVMMTLISPNLARLCLKNKCFYSHFVKALYKYSIYELNKVFSDSNFCVIVTHFMQHGFDEITGSIPTFEDNSEAYQAARVEFVNKATTNVKAIT